MKNSHVVPARNPATQLEWCKKSCDQVDVICGDCEVVLFVVDGKSLPETSHLIGSGNLVFHNVTPDDGGIYQCVSIDMSTIYAEATLGILGNQLLTHRTLALHRILSLLVIR